MSIYLLQKRKISAQNYLDSECNILSKQLIFYSLTLITIYPYQKFYVVPKVHKAIRETF